MATEATTANTAIPADLRARYEAAGQAQVFRFVDSGKVADEDLPGFIAQLSAIDTTFVNSVYKDTVAAHEAAMKGEGTATLTPMEDIAAVSTSSAEDLATWRTAGLAAVAAGEVAALMLAGGQGTRLGFSRPKGEYNLDLPSDKVIFRLLTDRVHRIKALAAAQAGVDVATVSLPFVVMTSPMTDADTRGYFEEQDYFGLGKDNVLFFAQGTLPCFDFDGKIVLEEPAKVAEAPDGNGGIYRALHLSGVMDTLTKRGVKYVHAFAVDNAVCKVADPVWVGYCITKGADMGCKVCAKAAPEEKVGVLCVRNGAFSVVEYSDLDETSMQARNDDGSIKFGAGNICIHFYTMDFLQTKCHPDTLPKEYHLAKKKIPYCNDAGETIPKSALKEDTGVKLESFIFDVCPMSKTMAALSVVREHEFSPVKNAPGNPVDSPDSARAILSNLHSAWLTAAGATLTGEGLVEVSGLVSYGGEGLEAFSGATLTRPCLVQAASEADAAADAAGAAFTTSTATRKSGTVNVYTLA